MWERGPFEVSSLGHIGFLPSLHTPAQIPFPKIPNPGLQLGFAGGWTRSTDMLQEQSVKFGEVRVSVCLVLRIPAVSTSHLCRSMSLPG